MMKEKVTQRWGGGVSVTISRGTHTERRGCFLLKRKMNKEKVRTGEAGFRKGRKSLSVVFF